MSDEKNSVFTVLGEDGKEVTYEALFTFDSDETKKSYIVYTDNTLDETGSTKVYASVFDPTGENKNLQPVETEKEWVVIENILSSLQEKMDDEEAPAEASPTE